MGNRTRHAVTNTLPNLFPDAFPCHGEDAPLDLPPLTEQTQAEVRDLLVSKRFDAWSEALARVGNCSRPIRLDGRSQTVDTATGEVLATYAMRASRRGDRAEGRRFKCA